MKWIGPAPGMLASRQPARDATVAGWWPADAESPLPVSGDGNSRNIL